MLALYVDDARIYYSKTKKGRELAELDMAKLMKRFALKLNAFDPPTDYFLGGNRETLPDGTLRVTSATYIGEMAKRYLDPAKKYPGAWGDTPASEELVTAYEHATRTRPTPPDELKQRYMSLFGALLHATKYRPEIDASLGLCGTCLTICTEELYTCLLRVLVYLTRTPNLGANYHKNAIDASVLRAYADSNWGIGRSTTGYVIMLGGAAIVAASRRQHCISMSSCEAELIALADLAIELLYVRGLLVSLGYDTSLPIDVYTDNKGAYDLCHRYSSSQHSRHVERKVYKMRELRADGKVNVNMVVGDSNPADLFTKIVSKQLFDKFRKLILGLTGRSYDG